MAASKKGSPIFSKTPNIPKAQLQLYLKRFWMGFAAFMGFLVVYFFFISMGWLGYMPSFLELENPQPLLATEVFSSDSVVIGRYYIENRSRVSYEQLPKHLVDALIATEDVRFYQHSGIDGRGLLRALLKPFLRGRGAGGASTITQQLAKNLFPRGEHWLPFHTVHQKFKEWVIATKLESRYTKQELIAFYFNTVQYNDQAYGIKTGSEYFFGKTPDKLTIEESAMMVGMLKGPSFYNPRRNPDRALKRRNTVIEQMVKYKYLTEQQGDSIKKLPLKLKRSLYNSRQGMAPYFNDLLRNEMLDWCSKNKKPDGTAYDLYRDGLKIYTTINSHMQLYAEESMREHLKKMQDVFYNEWKGTDIWKSRNDVLESAKKNSELYDALKEEGLSKKQIDSVFNEKILMNIFTWDGGKQMSMSRMDSIKYYKQILQSGFMSMEPQSGDIKAWVGGVDFNYFQYDHVRVGKRQVGSTFKPILYGFALENGLVEPCTQVSNSRICIPDGKGGEWCPDNSESNYDDRMVTVKFALANSINRVAAYLMEKSGPENVIKMAHNMGINTKDMRAYPSLALGVCDASVYEMVGAYACFDNKGNYVKPHYLLRIEDNKGRVLQRYAKEEKDAINEKTAYMMTHMMEGVINGETDPVTGKKSGTGMSLRGTYGLTGPIAGKTGTTQNNSDAWFIGFTPQLVSGAWVGCEDPDVHFRTTGNGQGAKLGLPIWGKFMQKVYADRSLKYKPNTGFSQSDSTWHVNFDCSAIPAGDSTVKSPENVTEMPK